MPFSIREFQQRTIVRHRETKAFELFSTILRTDEHTFLLAASSSAELEILWKQNSKILFDFNKVQKILVIAPEPIDENHK